MNSVPERGDVVTIPCGTRVFSSLPSFNREGKESVRTQDVTVFNAYVYPCPSDSESKCICVTWAGTGGYWRWAYFPYEGNK